MTKAFVIVRPAGAQWTLAPPNPGRRLEPRRHSSGVAIASARLVNAPPDLLQTNPASPPPLLGPPPPGRPAAVTAFLARAAWALLVVAGPLLLGVLIGRLSASKGASERITNEQEVASRFAGFPIPIEDETDSATEASSTPIWLNYALARLWILFQKNTKQLANEIMQPVLDDTVKPDMVTGVRIVSFTPGGRPPYLASLRRLPSRALAEVQYAIHALFSSTSEFRFEVDIEYKALKFSVPVSLRNLDIDATCWSSFTLVPYSPFCASLRYAFLENPKIGFDMTIADAVPITAVPILRSFFFRVITQEIPQKFLFPNMVNIDFSSESIRDKSGARDSMRVQDLAELSSDELVRQFPEQWSLFNALDLDNNGSLSPVEIFAGLKDWGYTATDASESFARLDINQDNSVSFLEFCQMWPALAASFVPSRYQGILTVFVRRADDLPRPWIGFADPVVTLRIGEEKVTGKRDSQTSGSGGPGSAVWNEAFELNCRSPSEEKLDILITEGNTLSWRGPRGSRQIGTASFPLASLMRRPNQQVKVRLEPGGYIRVDLSYADFIDKGTSP